MPSEFFHFKLSIAGENAIPSSLPTQVTKKSLMVYIRQRWTDHYVQREMVKYFSKFPSNTLNQMIGKLDQIAAEFERKRNEQQKENQNGGCGYSCGPQASQGNPPENAGGPDRKLDRVEGGTQDGTDG